MPPLLLLPLPPPLPLPQMPPCPLMRQMLPRWSMWIRRGWLGTGKRLHRSPPASSRNCRPDSHSMCIFEYSNTQLAEYSTDRPLVHSDTPRLDHDPRPRQYPHMTRPTSLSRETFAPLTPQAHVSNLPNRSQMIDVALDRADKLVRSQTQHDKWHVWPFPRTRAFPQAHRAACPPVPL